MVPNLYATMAYSENALGNYVTFQGGKTSLRGKEKEAVNLIVSQVNGCIYCLSAHTALGKMHGLTDEQIIEIRKGSASFDTKLDALVKLAKNITESRGKADSILVDNFFAAILFRQKKGRQPTLGRAMIIIITWGITWVTPG